MNHLVARDRIIAVATPRGEGAISMIRISGKESISVVNEFFEGANLTRTSGRTMHFGKILTKEGEVLDEVVVLIFRAPASYTGEEVVEISCHNSEYIIEQILLLFLSAGVRMAEPGEFTLRAYLHGKMDLSQAEAVADLIAAESRQAHQLALNQLRGGVSQEVVKLREQLIHFASMLELELDFAEEDVEFADRRELEKLLKDVVERIHGLIESFYWGNAIKKGVTTVIAGRPNAGKSTLLNVLLKEDRAIVSDIPGTTRDTIEEVLTIEGIDFRLIDTAGLRDAGDTIESMGVERTMKKISESTVLLYVFDVTELSGKEVQEDLEQLDRERLSVLVVANKMDQNPYKKPKEYTKIHKVVPISAINNMNIEYLKEEMVELVKSGGLDENFPIISNARHVTSLREAYSCLVRALENIKAGITSDFVAVDIRQATFHLGSIIGQVSSDDLLENIFRNFCIGK